MYNQNDMLLSLQSSFSFCFVLNHFLTTFKKLLFIEIITTVIVSLFYYKPLFWLWIKIYFFSVFAFRVLLALGIFMMLRACIFAFLRIPYACSGMKEKHLHTALL